MHKPVQKIYLVRHGETKWSLSGQHTGITDIPLTENGRRMAKLFKPLDVLEVENVDGYRLIFTPCELKTTSMANPGYINF